MTRGTTDGSHTFVCPDCGERILVDEEMLTVIVREGCMVCGADVSRAAFEPRT